MQFFARELTEFVHNRSLMIDIVEHKSFMRKVKPFNYLKYGEYYTINTGTLMYCVHIIKID